MLGEGVPARGQGAGFASLAPVGRLGNYDVLGRLAVGGMAEIFLARQKGAAELGRHLVLKRILPHIADDDRMVEMFVREAELCLNLHHPHICSIYEFGQDKAFFLAMEWVRGVSVRQLLDDVGPLPIPFAVRVFADIAAALHYAHTATDASHRPLSIVHRDVNPDNIMVGFDGVAKLLDFGVAKAANQKTKTAAGLVKGKLAYVSPEAYQGSSVDGRSDVFSLGASLYEALTGDTLFDRDSEYETVAAIVLGPDQVSARALRPEVPAELDAIIARAMMRDREQRTRSADAMAAELRRFLVEHVGMVRHADLARTVRSLCPERVVAEPQLERDIDLKKPPEPVDRLEQARLLADVDQDLEKLTRRRGGSWWVGLLGGLVILLSLAVIGWVVLGRRPLAAEPAAASPTEVESAIDPPAAEPPVGNGR